MLPPAPGPARVAAVAAVLLVTLAGCSDDQPASSSRHSASSGASTASSTPKPGASEPGPSPSSPSTGSARRSGGPLLTAEELPGPGAFRWAQGATTTTEPRSLGPCQRFGILAVGAERVVARHFTPADASVGHGLADEVVATFPDEMTARRAYAVLVSWRARCGDRLRRFGDPELGDLQQVPVADGQASWYLLSYAPNKAAPHHVLVDAQGMAQLGRRIAILRLAGSGERNGDLRPSIEAGVVAAAARLRPS